MKKQERTNVNTNSEPSAPKDFHCYFSYGTAEWLRSKKDRDAKTVAAVVRKIIEEAERQDKKGTGSY